MTGFDPSPEQAAILEAPLVSLRVAAGAGTGKTATVAGRVVELVRNHGLEPEQILGITFTNKAAEELADRIRLALTGYLEPGREVEIHTYHGFASSVLREFGPLVGVERDAGVITPVFSRQLLAGVVTRLQTEIFDPTLRMAVDKPLRLASALADNLLTPEEARPPTGEPFLDPWPERLELLNILEAYEQEKRRLGVVDYGDLIRLAHRTIAGHPAVVDQLRSRYRAVMLDEYQDTNPAQRELLRVAFAGATPVMAVGDADQTIYEWRGASLENFAEFPDHFADDRERAPTFPLSLNRRSGSKILDVANLVRNEIQHQTRPGLKALPGVTPGRVTTVWHDDAVAEADWIAEEMRALHDRGTAWSEIGVLFRKNRDMATVHDALARHDIPFEVANLGGLLSVPEVTDLWSWLRILHRPEDGPALTRLLVGNRFKLGLGDVAPLARWVREEGAEESELDDDRIPHLTLVEGIDRLEELHDLRPAARTALERFRREYRLLLAAAQGLSLVELSRSILDTTGAWTDLEAMGEAAGLSARLNLYRFLDLAEAWSPLEGRPSLGAFCAYLASMADDPHEELDTARLSDEDAVTLITVHRAKGLEWPVVFVPAVHRDNFPARSSQFDNPLRFPESLPYELRIDRASSPDIDQEMSYEEQKDRLRARHDQQEWRIAYVAVTRPRQHLYVTGAWWYGTPEPRRTSTRPSRLFELATQLADEHIAPGPVPDRPATLGYRTEAAAPPDPLFEGSWPVALRSTLADTDWPRSRARSLGIGAAYDQAVAEYQQLLFSLPEPSAPTRSGGVETSATGLVTYAQCPRRYYWSNVDRLPRRVDPAARRGVDVHRRIELHNLGRIPFEEMSETAYDVSAIDHVPTGADPFSVFKMSRFSDPAPRFTEAPFELVLPGDVRVRGRIDAIYDTGGNWEVVDFKTGRPRRDEYLLVQLETYAVAAADVPFAAEPPRSTKVTFAYLGGGQLIEQTHSVDDEWLAAARRRLERLAGGIAGEQWDPVPSAACRGCDFQRFCPEGRSQMGGS